MMPDPNPIERDVLSDLADLTDLASRSDGKPLARGEVAAVALLASVEIRRLRELIDHHDIFLLGVGRLDDFRALPHIKKLMA